MPPASTLAAQLPRLRRYARALTGSQGRGDALVAATLEAIAGERRLLPGDVSMRLGLVKVFQGIAAATPQSSTNAAGSIAAESPHAALASARLSAMMPLPRQALLLAAMEGFAENDVAYLIGCDTQKAVALIADALADIDRQTRTRVLIIEDEPIIAMDIEAIVTGLGHSIIGVAATHRQAMAMVAAEAPGLVLADIQLRDGSSGIDAVSDLLAIAPVPAIFITGFPERLLTGERPEPSFLVEKPFRAASVRATIGQALFFSPTASPHG